MILCKIVEIDTVNLKPSGHKLMAEIFYYGKLTEFDTAAYPDHMQSYGKTSFAYPFLNKIL